jgi:hypothetical protein
MKSIPTLLATAYMLALNSLANGLPLNGKTTGELSAQYPNVFVPAGLTFSIWGVLYLLMLAYVGKALLDRHRNGVEDRVEPLYVATAVLNGTWIVAWHYEWMAASLLIMLGLLGTLVWVGIRMKEDGSFLLTRLTFGMYLGWIIVATGANVTAALVDWNWAGWGLAAGTWATGLVAVASAIAMQTSRVLGNRFVLLSVAWALLGILIKQVGGPETGVVIAAALFLGIVIREGTDA